MKIIGGLDSDTSLADITSVVAGTGLSGGGTTGAVTLNVDAAQTQITSVGTIGTGVWQGTAIASEYLDADTAHLGGIQTFTGRKKFNLIDSAIFAGNLDVTPRDGAKIHVGAATITDSVTSASGTAIYNPIVSIEQHTIAATNASVTNTHAASLFIGNAPTAGTNMTLTNSYALWVGGGLVKFDGALTVSGTITGNVTGNVTGDVTGQADTVATIAGLAPNTATTQATQPAIDSIGTDGDTLNILGDRLEMENTTTDRPQIKLMNTTEDAISSRLSFWKSRKNGGTIQDGVDNDVVGQLDFWSYDDGTPTSQVYAKIYADIHDATSGEESGRLTFQVANHDGGLGSGLILTGAVSYTHLTLPTILRV
jgi:hypothetical protein